MFRCIAAYENEDRLLWDPTKLENPNGKVFTEVSWGSYS